MIELKTLKDLEKLANNNSEKFLFSCIKAEAIKWAKHFGYTENHTFCKFHNITEEDLKEKEK